MARRVRPMVVFSGLGVMARRLGAVVELVTETSD